MEQKFQGDDEKTRESRCWEFAQWLTAIIRPKSKNKNIRHDGIDRKFHADDKYSFCTFSADRELVKNKKQKVPISVHGNMQFPIYSTVKFVEQTE
jgi:hypothetical protein